MSHPIESTVYIGLGDKKSVYQSSCEIFIAAEKLFSPTLFSCLWLRHFLTYRFMFFCWLRELLYCRLPPPPWDPAVQYNTMTLAAIQDRFVKDSGFTHFSKTWPYMHQVLSMFQYILKLKCKKLCKKFFAKIANMV